MKIKIEMDLPRWLSRLILIGIPVAVVAIAAWVYAGVPNTFNAGDTLSAQKLNANFAVVATPPGTVVAFAGPVVPTEWLLCDGSAKSRSTYSALFSVIGTVHGSGDGASTFNLPDYRGRFLRGVDNGTGRDPEADSRSQAQSGGNTSGVGTVQGDAFQVHAHYVLGMPTSNYPHGYPLHAGLTPGINHAGLLEQILQGDAVGLDVAMTADDIIPNSAGVAPLTSTETRPKNAYVNYIIKY